MNDVISGGGISVVAMFAACVIALRCFRGAFAFAIHHARAALYECVYMCVSARCRKEFAIVFAQLESSRLNEDGDESAMNHPGVRRAFSLQLGVSIT